MPVSMFSRLQPKRIREARAIAADSILNDFILVVFVSKIKVERTLSGRPLTNKRQFIGLSAMRLAYMTKVGIFFVL
jgi:hypothetical protein